MVIFIMRLVIVFISSCFLFYSAASQSIVETLPGYSGNLPFKLETGYVSVGESDDIEMFYYFIESERDAEEDPLLLWLAGGPGCSAVTAIAFEIGPIAFDASSFNGSFPSLILRQHYWTKIVNVIFLDWPAGTGFSYGTQADSYNTSDTLSAKYIDTFFRKWLLNHPVFIKNDLYVGGDSYGGKITPIVVLEMLHGNEAGLKPQIPIQGYLVGNPITDADVTNSQIPYAHGMALISTEYYELAKSSCFGQYVNPDPDNVQCHEVLELINNCLLGISRDHILEASCSSGENERGVMLLEDDSLDVLLSSKQVKTLCHEDMINILSNVWANNQEVQDALHVRKGTIKEWRRCNTLVPAYKEDVVSAVPYHQVLTQKISKALVYSGDHDLTAPYIAPLRWIPLFNLTIDDSWRPWNVNGQIAGYTQRYKKDGHYLTFATVKGAGHVAVDYSPAQCFAMFDRWITSKPL